MSSLYGPIVSAFHAENAVRTTIQTWIDTYLGEIERRSSGRWALRAITRPKSWQVVTDYRAHTADRKLPCVAVETGQMASERVEEGRIDGEFAMNVIVIGKGNDRDRTRELVGAYEAAIRIILEQKGALGGFASETFVGSASYDAISAEKSKTVAGATIPIVVVVPNIGNRFGGPVDPDPGPPTSLPGTSPEDAVHLTTNVTVDEE